MGDLILALDQGTTSSRALLFDGDGQIVALTQEEHPQRYPRPGWVEHDPEAIWETQLGTARRALAQAGVRAGDVAVIGITNQRETTLLWERATGRPISPAIVWQDRRTAGMCEALVAQGLAGTIQDKTGLVLDAYFSGTKLRWLLDNTPGARERAERGELAFGTVDTFLLWRLTGGAVHATDVSNASRTLLFNIHTLDWDEVLLEIFAIPRSLLPRVCPSSYPFGETAPDALGAPVAIGGVAGDQQAATFGQACYAPGMVKNTYGTGSFLLMNTGSTPHPSHNRLLTTIAWSLGQGSGVRGQGSGVRGQGSGVGGHPTDRSVSDAPRPLTPDPRPLTPDPRPLTPDPRPLTPDPRPLTPDPPLATYALEGSVFVTGAAVQWLRDELGIIRTAAETEALAASVPDTGGVYLVPAFVGLGAPYWDSGARGALMGLTRGTGRAHLARAALEAACYQTRDVIEAMQSDCGAPLRDLRVDGGMTANNLLLQMQADLLGIPVHRPAVTETTALGAAYLAGLAAGWWSGTEEIADRWRVERTFEPQISTDQRETLYEGWKRAVRRVMSDE